MTDVAKKQALAMRLANTDPAAAIEQMDELMSAEPANSRMWAARALVAFNSGQLDAARVSATHGLLLAQAQADRFACEGNRAILALIAQREVEGQPPTVPSVVEGSKPNPESYQCVFQ